MSQHTGYSGAWQREVPPGGARSWPRPGSPPDYLDALDGGPPWPVPRRGKRRIRRTVAIAAAVVAALVVVLGAAGFTAYTLLAGSGVALDRQVPADAVAFAEINLDPPAGQKIAAMRFLGHLRGGSVSDEDGDLTGKLVEPVIQSPDDRRKFVEDVKPWLGKHAAVSAERQGSRVEPIVVVETTDAGKARSGLDELTRDGSGEYGYAISGRTVVLARTDSVAQAAVDSARRGSLHDNDTFRRDLRMVGEGGVLTVWADLARAADTSTDSPTAGLRGRLVASLQFTDTAADLKIHAVGLPPSGLGAETVGPRLAALPDDTALTLGISGADKIVQRAYDGADKSTLGESVGALGERTGLVLPDDLAALVGSSTVVAVGGSDGGVDVGLISRTDDTDTARSAAQRLLNALGQDNNALAVRSVSDGTVLANSSSYADRLGTPGRLGDSQLFRDALPDLGSAQAALYVDVQRLSKLGGVTPPGPVDRFRSLGVTAAVSADTATIRLRLVVA